MLSKLRFTTPQLWLCAWVLVCISQISHKTFAQGALTITQPTYNCATGAIVFNTTGGNGSTITYSAPGISRADATSNNGVIEAGLRADPKPIVITATQNGVSTSFTFNLAAACPGNFALTQPTYNCSTGAITFNITGGDGSPITYTAPGVSRSSATSNSGTVEAGLRADPKVLVITAVQGGATSVFRFDLAAFCGSNPTPPNRAPVFSGTLTTGTGITGVPFSYTLPNGAFTDPDAGQTLTYTAIGLPTGLSINSATGAITGTTTSTGVNSYTIVATDPGGLSASTVVGATFSQNLSPVFSGTLASVTVISGAPFSYSLPTGAFTDPNTGQVLGYTATGLPSGLSISSGSGGITGTASTTGNSTVVLTATDTGGLSASTTLGVVVVPNVAPVFSGSLASVSATVGTPLSYTLPTGTFTDANTGQALGYTATGLPAGLSINAGTGAITGTPSATGTNSVTLTARDTGGLSTSGVVSIVVGPNLPPVFSGTLVSATGTVGSALSYTLPTGAFTDPNAGQTLRYTAVGLPAGLSLNAGTGAITGTPSASGVSSVTLTATDPVGASTSGSFSISVGANTAPVFSGTLASGTGTVGSAFSYTLPTGAFTDANGQTLTYTAVGLPAGFSINAGTGAITGTPSASGVSSVTITATDPANAAATGAFSISVSPAPTPTFSGSLASATGTVGQAFSYTLPTGTFTTGGGQTLSYAATGLPAGLSINTGTGAITGTPTTAGSSTVTLRATNTGNQSATGTLVITISPVPSPTFTGTLVSATGTVGQAFSYTLPTGSFTDPGGQTLTYAATGLPGGLSINPTTGAISGTPTAAGSNTITLRATNPGGQSASTTVGITISTSATSGTGTAPVFSGSLASATGTVGQAFSYTLPTGTFTGGASQTLTYAATGLPAGLTINGATGTISGTPTTAGSSTVTLRATNTGGQSASGTVGITINTSATSGTGTSGPVFSGSLVSATGTVGQAFSYTLPTGTFTGGANQTLTYAATGLPAGLSINTTTGAISGTPTTAGSSTVSLQATSGGQSASGTLGITITTSGSSVTGTTPTFNGTLVSASGVVGQAFSYSLPAGTFTPGVNQTLTYAATGLPAGLTINAATGAISGTPTTAGSSTVTLRGTNTAGQSASGTLGITISASGTSGTGTTGTTPVFTGTLVSATGVVGRAFSYTLPTGSFTDPGSQTLGYAATGLPAGLSINTTTGAISGTPTTAGSSTVTIRATNPGGSSASAVVSITISASTSGGRIATETEAQPISIVAVGGNPIVNGIVEVEVSGVAGEAVQVQLTNMKGEVVSQQRRERAQDQERFRFDVSRNPGGTLLLRAATATRAHTIRLLKVD